MTKEIKGIHVAAMFVGGFAVIIAVNLLLAVQAVRTFPGLEVKNSYVASQTFETDRAAQEALGWTLSAKVEGETLRLVFEGETGPETVTARLGRATHTADDRQLTFTWEEGGFVAAVPGLATGGWYLWVEAKAADGTAFRQRLDLRVRS